VSPEPWRRLARAEARFAGRGTTVAGVDEAGRGPLAGPVVAAAVVLAPGGRWEGLDDSKQVAPDTREKIFARVLIEARAFSWSVIGPRAIDRSNILRASLEAMRRAVCRLRVTPDLVLVDGDYPVPGLSCNQRAVVDGDARLISIAAASMVPTCTPTCTPACTPTCAAYARRTRSVSPAWSSRVAGSHCSVASNTAGASVSGGRGRGVAVCRHESRARSAVPVRRPG